MDLREKDKAMKHWTQMTEKEERQDLIDRLVFAGVKFSYYLRINETVTIAVGNYYYGAPWRDLLTLAHLPGRPIVEHVNVADLNHVQASVKEQWYWTAEKWEEEIISRLTILDALSKSR